jgi:dCTP diphosphatase
MASHPKLVNRLRHFTAARDWEQFHSPKNLAMALSGEVGELVAELQWLSDAEIAAGLEDGSPLRDALENEIADVFIYLVRLADKAGIDLYQVADAKIDRNEERYPVSVAYGSAVKYKLLDHRGQA